LSINYIPGNSFLHRLNPVPKMAYWAVLTILAAAFFGDPILLGLIFVFGILIPWAKAIRLAMFKQSLRTLISLFPFYLVLGILFFVPPRDAVFLFHLIPQLKLLPITVDMIVWTIGIFMKFLIIIACFWMILVTSPLPDIVRSFSKFRIPWPLVLATSLGLSYVPVMVEEISTVQEAQRSRGHRFEYRNPINRAKAMGPLLVPLLSLSIAHSERLTLAIQARGYGYAVEKRTELRDLSFHTLDYAAFVIVFVLAAVFLYAYFYTPHLIDYTFTMNLLRRFL